MLRKICIFVVALLCFSMSSHSVVLNHVVVFGDSLSDTGNLYTYTHHTTPSSPTYHQGRFSNGPIWIDAFMDGYAADHVLNYAFGGAGVLTEIWNLGVFTLHQEVDTYLLTHSDLADESSLFFIWIGANNYLVRGEQPNAQAIIDGILSNIERLIQHGARNFVVINLPDLGRSPAAKFMGVEQSLHLSTEKHNALLARSIVDLREKYTRTNIMYFDVNTLYDDVFNHAAKYGFTNTIDSCTGNILDMQLATSMFMMSVNMPACAGYMFFDPIHPTTKTHQLLAKHLATFIESQGVFIKSTSRPLIAHT